ncbi:unnamed protein product [Urochloa humidicola]
MSFVMAMDALNRLFVKANEDGVLQPTGIPAIKHHCSLYADDVILFPALTATEARATSRIFGIFGDASGLQANSDKCSITPIFGCETALDEFRVVLPCAVVQSTSDVLGCCYLQKHCLNLSINR